MIVRVIGEGQLELAREHLDELNRLDDEVASAVEAGDEARFRSALGALLGRVREVGTPVPADQIAPSDLVLPGDDSSLQEVSALLSEEGLIPG